MSAASLSGLNQRLQLYRREAVADAAGGHAAVLVPLLTLWGRVTAVGARASADADGRTANLSHTVVIRHRAGVKPGDRFTWRGRKLDVLSAEDLSGRRQFLCCRCTEVAVTG